MGPDAETPPPQATGACLFKSRSVLLSRMTWGVVGGVDGRIGTVLSNEEIY